MLVLFVDCSGRAMHVRLFSLNETSAISQEIEWMRVALLDSRFEFDFVLISSYESVLLSDSQ